MLKCHIWIHRNQKHVITRDMLKDLFRNSKQCHAKISNSLKENQIYIGEVIPEANQSSVSPGLMIFNKNNDDNIIDIVENVKINQEIFFLNLTNQELFESYVIERVMVIQRTLGWLKKLKNNQTIVNLTENKAFLERRSDFHGKHFIAMTESFYPYASIMPNYIHEAKFYEANQTYDVTHYTKGAFFLEKTRSKKSLIPGSQQETQDPIR